MKTPLFLFFTFFAIHLFSACEKTPCYYHIDKAYGYIKGNLKTVTDTTYAGTDTDFMYPLETKEYRFDTLNRCVEMKQCSYRNTMNEADGSYHTSLETYQLSKFRYDIDGRRVESHYQSCYYLTDSVVTYELASVLSGLDVNHEKWDMTLREGNGEEKKIRVDRHYTKDTLSVIYLELESQRKDQNIYIFDANENMIEIHENYREDGENVLRRAYTYNEYNQMVRSAQGIGNNPIDHNVVLYQQTEFDSEGNWIEEILTDENGDTKGITRRRIEYR